MTVLSCQSAVRLIPSDNYVLNNLMERMTCAIHRPFATIYLFSRLAALHCFFQVLNIHSLVQKAQDQSDLFQHRSEFRDCHNVFSGSNVGEAAFLILLFALEQQARLNSVNGKRSYQSPPSPNGADLLLRSFTLVASYPNRSRVSQNLY